jgi:hypothetical protein
LLRSVPHLCILLPRTVYIRQSPSFPISVLYMHRTPFQITKCHKHTIPQVSSISRFPTSYLPVVLPATSELRIIPSTQVPRKQHSFQPVCFRGALFFLFGSITRGFLLRTSPPFKTGSLETSALETCLGGDKSNSLPEEVIANTPLMDRR